MAGCFGNSPYDRWLESQVDQYCNGEGDAYFEQVCEAIPEDTYYLYENYILNDIAFDEWVLTLMHYGVTIKVAALTVEVLLKRHYGNSEFITKKTTKQ